MVGGRLLKSSRCRLWVTLASKSVKGIVEVSNTSPSISSSAHESSSNSPSHPHENTRLAGVPLSGELNTQSFWPLGGLGVLCWRLSHSSPLEHSGVLTHHEFLLPPGLSLSTSLLLRGLAILDNPGLTLSPPAGDIKSLLVGVFRETIVLTGVLKLGLLAGLSVLKLGLLAAKASVLRLLLAGVSVLNLGVMQGESGLELVVRGLGLLVLTGVSLLKLGLLAAKASVLKLLLAGVSVLNLGLLSGLSVLNLGLMQGEPGLEGLGLLVLAGVSVLILGLRAAKASVLKLLLAGVSVLNLGLLAGLSVLNLGLLHGVPGLEFVARGDRALLGEKLLAIKFGIRSLKSIL